MGLERFQTATVIFVASASPRTTNHHWKGRGQITWTN